MEYCRYSASPVGRQLLDLHGESRDTWHASDALCSALQVLNHLQDCSDDYRSLDRVYLPLDLMGEAGVTVEELTAGPASPGMRLVIDRLLDATDRLIATAGRLPGRVAARGLRWESATIVHLARLLSRRLRRGDPLATRVALSKGDFATALVTGIVRGRRSRSINP
jgi:farnesyl-diphosphate farnesyltransferase